MSDISGAVDILLVEDNATDAELAMRALRKHNLANSIAWVKDGAEALDFIFAKGAFASRSIQDPPKVILLDLHLPKVSGMDVLRQVKSDERTRIIPVVVLTSSKEERDITDSYQLGVNSYISKPVEFEEFVKVVAELGLYWMLVNKSPLNVKAP